MRNPDVTSRIMSTIRSTETKAEVALRSELFRRGIRFRKNYRRLPGAPDIVFTGARVCVFIDGDFWHGREWRRRGFPTLRDAFKTNADFWVSKIQATIARDRENTAGLRKMGWHVLRLWESTVTRDIPRAADRVQALLSAKGEPK
jgi:DNA mismatch endonuclease (patch repair protein)